MSHTTGKAASARHRQHETKRGQYKDNKGHSSRRTQPPFQNLHSNQLRPTNSVQKVFVHMSKTLSGSEKLYEKFYYVDGKVRDVDVEGVIDTAATNCFISPGLVEKAGLKLEKNTEQKLDFMDGTKLTSEGYLDGKQLLIKVYIGHKEKSREATALADTGSDAMLISANFAADIDASIEEPREAVQLANGKEVQTLGRVKNLTFTFRPDSAGPRPLSSRTRPESGMLASDKNSVSDFYVLDKLPVDMILSSQLLFEHNVFQDDIVKPIEHSSASSNWIGGRTKSLLQGHGRRMDDWKQRSATATEEEKKAIEEEKTNWARIMQDYEKRRPRSTLGERTSSRDARVMISNFYFLCKVEFQLLQEG
ncbi:hypothetical protein LTS17_000485 [Exophiala oligosperma]